MALSATQSINCPTTKLAVGVDRELGMAFLLTPCCNATGKGDADASTCVVCRACGDTVSPLFAMAYMGELDGLSADLIRLNYANGCPDAEGCAYTMAHKASEELGA